MISRQRAEAARALQADQVEIFGPGSTGARRGDGPSWTSDLGGALREVVAVWGEEPAAATDGAVDMAAATAMAFRWLVAPRDLPLAEREARRRIGRSDVQRLRAVRRTLKAVDNAHGGGSALPMAIAYLRREATPLMHGRYDDRIGTALLGAIAELTLDVDGLRQR